MAIVGSGLGGGCAPSESNYARFFDASRGPSWEVDIRDAGHFSFLDQASPLQRAVCPAGATEDEVVRRVSQAVMVAWAETIVRRRGFDFKARAQLAYPAACLPPEINNSSSSAPVVLPTWSSPLPQFYEDILGPMRAVGGPLGIFGRPAAAPAETGRVFVSDRDLALQRAAEEARKRVLSPPSSSPADATSADARGESEWEQEARARNQLLARRTLGADVSLEKVLSRMLDKLLAGTSLERQVGVRFKGFHSATSFRDRTLDGVPFD